MKIWQHRDMCLSLAKINTYRQRSERNTIRRERAQENKKWNTVRSELAMLKAKIADAPIASVRVDDRMHVSIGARSNAVDFVPLHTKRVRLVVEE